MENRPTSLAESSRSSLFSRVFSGLSLSRSDAESYDDVRGPYGLNLLSAPAEPFVDLIFVHGLGGGSRKTWSYGRDPALFWPKELSRCPEFKQVRIHSFGYDSHFLDRREIGIGDFAKFLLATMQGSAFIRRNNKLPIILVAHSMGGLVIKKAYLLARDDPAFRELGERFHTMYFLATPHRGAASAEVLSLVLQASFSANRQLVKELHRNSATIEVINDAFMHVARHVRLFSFFETKPTSLGGLRDVFIVNKASATIGIPNERISHLNGDHRGICKFVSPDDPNFKILKDALVETLDVLQTDWAILNRERLKTHIRSLRTFLCISDAVETSCIEFGEPRADGSCEWLSQKQEFRTWRDHGSTRLFWLCGKPATGKSYIAGYVAEHLASLSNYTSVHFFREGDKSKVPLSKCLLSLAYQMALSDATIRNAFLEMQDDDVHFDRENYHSIWRKLFVGGIFQLELHKPHFWVVDALDESQNPLDLLTLFLKMPPTFPLRIFLTSRPNLELQCQIDSVGIAAKTHEITPDDTLEDIMRYIESLTNLPSMQGPGVRQQLISMILEKAEGCFFWVSLVLKELRKVNSEVATRTILEDVPRGMDSLYLRILDKMANVPYGKSLAIAILQWAVCSTRAMTTAELTGALKIDIDDQVPNLENQIASLCGHMVYVDTKLRIRMTHQTVRSFLLRTDINSEFTFPEKAGHLRLAIACLKCLLDDNLRAPRARRASTLHTPSSRSPFHSYAATAFYEHVDRSSSENDELLSLLFSFLSSPKGNVLSWIEYIAAEGELYHLIQTGKVLKRYLKRRAKHSVNLGKEVKAVEMWGTDLIRIVAKFGQNILRSPASIYRIIPPFCPRESGPYQQYGISARGISVKGLSSTTWDDRLACILYNTGYPTAVACSGGHFAVGTSDGIVRLYYSSTCVEVGMLRHDEWVENLEFNVSGQLLASTGPESVKVWDVGERQQKWAFSTTDECLAMTFETDNSALVLACLDNHLYTLDLSTGLLKSTEPWYKDVGHSEKIYSMPVKAAFSLEHGLLAFVYRGGHINLWNWRDGCFLGVCEKPSASEEVLPFHARSLVFNPASGSDSLAAAYEGGTLIVFDPLEGTIKATFHDDTPPPTLASSNDGRTLVSGDSTGTIRIFDFEAFDNRRLKILYVIRDQVDNICRLAFCSDDLKFVDIRGQRGAVNVWEPTVLVRQVFNEETSDAVSVEAQEVTLPQRRAGDAITGIAIWNKAGCALCGTEKGSVKVVDLSSGRERQTLYKHPGGFMITRLVIDEDRGIVASADLASNVLVHRIENSGLEWTVQSLLTHHMNDLVEDLLFNVDCSRLLVGTTSEDDLLILGDKTKAASLSWSTRNWGIWTNQPHSLTNLCLVVHGHLQTYSWDGLKKLGPDSGIHLEHGIDRTYDVKEVYFGWNDNVLVTEYKETRTAQPKRRIVLWNLTDTELSNNKSPLVPHPVLQPVGDRLEQLVGTYGKIIGSIKDHLIFLDQNGWICSIGMEPSVPSSYKRHFFLPNDWLSTNDEHLFGISTQQDIVFAKGNELAVIARGLECVEVVPFS